MISADGGGLHSSSAPSTDPTSSPTCLPWPPGSLLGMQKVGVVGAGGRMGQEVCHAVEEADDLELVAGLLATAPALLTN